MRKRPQNKTKKINNQAPCRFETWTCYIPQSDVARQYILKKKHSEEKRTLLYSYLNVSARGFQDRRWITLSEKKIWPMAALKKFPLSVIEATRVILSIRIMSSTFLDLYATRFFNYTHLPTMLTISKLLLFYESKPIKPVQNSLKSCSLCKAERRVYCWEIFQAILVCARKKNEWSPNYGEEKSDAPTCNHSWVVRGRAFLSLLLQSIPVLVTYGVHIW